MIKSGKCFQSQSVLSFPSQTRVQLAFVSWIPQIFGELPSAPANSCSKLTSNRSGNKGWLSVQYRPNEVIALSQPQQLNHSTLKKKWWARQAETERPSDWLSADTLVLGGECSASVRMSLSVALRGPSERPMLSKHSPSTNAGS